VFAAPHESGSGLTACLSADHTQAATTGITTVEDDGRSYNVIFLTQTTVNPAFGPAPRFYGVGAVRHAPTTCPNHSGVMVV
jgi:hypothetical protein